VRIFIAVARSRVCVRHLLETVRAE
jgi:hypothetical protein